MRSSIEVQADIDEREAWQTSLFGLSGAVAKMCVSLSEIAGGFKSAGTSIAAAGTMKNRPFDEGKMEQQSQIFYNKNSEGGTIIGEISVATREIEDELKLLRKELQDALDWEEEMRRRYSNSGGYNTTSANTPTATPKKTHGCFLKGTKVVTKAGMKKIEEISIGDIVLSFNCENMKNEYHTVTNIFVHKKSKDFLYSLKIEDFVVDATSMHRFYIKKNSDFEWVEARKLKVGDVVMNSNFQYHKIKEILKKHIKEDVYNIEVEQNHNYYVTENEILVHNIKAIYN